MMLWSDEPKYGFLRKDKLLHLQSVLTNMIYADELKEVYGGEPRSHPAAA